MIVVVDENFARRQLTIHQIVRRKNISVAWNGARVLPPHAIAPPGCARGKNHMRRTRLENILGGHWAGGIEINIWSFVDLCQTPIHHAPPFAEAGERRLKRHTPARFAFCICQDDVIPALTKRPRGFQTRRSCADDQNFICGFFRRDDFRMPAASPFLAHAWVLRTADGNVARVACDADITADALADVFEAVFFYFVGQERVSDAGTRRANEVHNSALDGGCH